ncbi:MAG TPA: DoxX family protein [Terriglobales bacterium]|nr:DoxX family protein [Terriglobales bacterium]
MARKVVYWITTVLVVAQALIAGALYVSGAPVMVQNFTHVGYPQQLRVILGVGKLLAAIALLVPGFARLKEWAYAGLAFAWISAHIAHHLANDGAEQYMPLLLLVLLFTSYFTRPDSRKLQAPSKATAL